MEFQDKVLKCIDCGEDFIFTAGEQLFFHDKQFKNEPKRCKACKTKRVAVLGAPPAPGQAIATPKSKPRRPVRDAGSRRPSRSVRHRDVRYFAENVFRRVEHKLQLDR